jgi:membrane protein
MLTAFGIVIFGGSVGGGLAGAIGLEGTFQTVWSIVQWPIVACIVLFTFAIIYFFAPAAKQKFAWISPGAFLAFVFWLLFSLAFSYYVGTFGGSDSYSATYGSLASVIILLLYIYYSSFIMLIGAEMNQVIEWHIPGGKDEGEKIPEEDRKPDVHQLSRAKEGEGRS